MLKNSLLILVAATLLAGCSSSLLGGKVGGPSTVQAVPVGNPLTLPPDLSLPPPGQTQSGYAANPPASAGAQTANADLYAPATPAPARPAAPAGDVYAQYGISKTNADGTPKSDGQLKAELKKAVLRKKQTQNPRYGTVYNIGNIFNDE